MAVVTTNLGAVTAYADAVAGGYTGTKAEWQALMASYATVAEEAAQSATDAETAKNAAVTAKTDAQTAKTDAIAAKTAAQTAQTAAETAQGKAEDAQTAAETAASTFTTDTTLEVSGKAADAKATGDAIDELKENLSGLESDGVAPSAEQLLSKNTTADAVPYHFRQTGGDGADREYVDAIVGGTVNWNQLVPIPQNNASLTQNGVTITDNRDGSFTVSTEEGGATANVQLTVANVSVTNGSKVVFYGCPTGGSTSTFFFGTSATYAETGNGKMRTLGGVNYNFSIYVMSGTVLTTPKTFRPQVKNLTAMFGTTIADYIYSLETATAGAGVAFFKKLFPNDYYPYNAGTLEHVSGLSAHKMVGLNQWDEEWEVGNIDPTTGQNTASTSHIRTKNYIPVLGGASYNIHAPWAMIIQYNANKAFLRSGSTGVTEDGLPHDKAITFLSDVAYIRFRCTGSYGITYKNDICINLSDPTKNGTYEPYEEHSYPLDDSLTLRGIPKLDANNNLYYDGDEYEADGTVTRKYGIITLVGGSEAVYTSNGISTIASHGFVKIADKAFGQYNMVSDKFITARTGTDFIGKMNGRDSAIGIEFSLPLTVEATNDAVKAWFAENPTTVVYELATPTIEEATPYRQLQICDPNGTEEFVSTGIVPVGHETRYPENLRAKIEGLPWDFSSLIAPTEKTATASRNYTTGSLLIMGNVLYKVTANIANGGTITPNTNVTATTLSEILSALAQ